MKGEEQKMAPIPSTAASAVIVDASDCQKVRKQLEDLRIFDKSLSIKRLSSGKLALPSLQSSQNTANLLSPLNLPINIGENLHFLPSKSSTATAASAAETSDRQLLDVERETKAKFSSSSSTSKPSTSRAILRERILAEVISHQDGVCDDDEIRRVRDGDDNSPEAPAEDILPARWEVYGDLIVFPRGSFDPLRQYSRRKYDNEDKLWKTIAKTLNVSRIVIQNRIHPTHEYRRPQVEFVFGADNPWVTKVENGVKYRYDVTKCMFSRGNITEKIRLANLNCKGQIVVDMFAGIGYFTLPFLIHSGAKLVHACEWNPDAVEALKVNLQLNHVERDRCVIHHGDNRIVCPENVADRVNLGLIPSAECSYATACKALRRQTGGVLHLHGNVDTLTTAPSNECGSIRDEDVDGKENRATSCWARWADSTKVKIERILNEIHLQPWIVRIDGVYKVKSYAAHVDHVVVDLVCTPSDLA